MKELSIEEKKVKRYDEAIETARKINSGNGVPAPPDWTICEVVFPELTESEDERIRKELLEHCKNQAKPYIQTGNKYPQIQSWIAWLEKQGTPAKLSEEEQNRFAKGVLTSYALSFIDYLDAHKYEGKMCVSNGECEDIENAFHNAMWYRLHRYYCKYIEKQGEQKPITPKFKINDVIKYNQKQWTIIGIDINNHCYDLDNDECVDFDTADYIFELVEQKTTEWSEEDEKYLKLAIDNFQTLGNSFLTAWLKSLKNKVQLKVE